MKVSPRQFAGGLAVLGVGLAAWALWPRAALGPEEQIRHLVVEMAHAAEKKDLSFVLEQISPRFRSDEGWSKDDVKGVLAAQVLQGQWVRVFVVDTDVSLESPTRAHFKGRFLFGRSDAKDLKDLAAQSQVEGHEIQAELEQEDGHWRFVSAQHRPLDSRQLLSR